jgi:hypothetical protein
MIRNIVLHKKSNITPRFMKKVGQIKLLNSEYWPKWAFYLPLIPLIFVFGLIQKHLFFFTNVNPGIDAFGGFFSDSKHIIDRKILSHFRPKSFLVNPPDVFLAFP